MSAASRLSLPLVLATEAADCCARSRQAASPRPWAVPRQYLIV